MYYETPPAEDRDRDAPLWHIVEVVPLPSAEAAGSHGAPNDVPDASSWYGMAPQPGVFAASGPALPDPTAHMRTPGTRPLFDDLDAYLQASTSELEALAPDPAASGAPVLRTRRDAPTYAVARQLVTNRRVTRQRSRFTQRMLRLGVFIVALVALAIVVGVGGPLLLHHTLPIRIGPFSLFAN